LLAVGQAEDDGAVLGKGPATGGGMTFSSFSFA
jgi:hypothetical protein